MGFMRCFARRLGEKNRNDKTKQVALTPQLLKDRIPFFQNLKTTLYIKSALKIARPHFFLSFFAFYMVLRTIQ